MKLALPIILANITVPLVGVVDTAIMGRMAEPVYIGASAIGATIFSSVYWLFGFLRMSTGGLVAQAQGREDAQAARATLYRGIALALLIALLLFSLQYPIIQLSLKAFSASAQMRELVSQYFAIRICSAPATLMLYVVIGTLIGLQRMRAVLIVQLLLNLSNIALNIAFFNWLHWGIEGVALASVLSEYLGLAIGLRLISRHIPVSISKLLDPQLFTRARVLELISINANLLIRTLCLIASFYWLTVLSSGFGELTLAANTILLQMLHMVAYALDGFSHTAESLAGQAYGRRNRQQFRISVRVCSEWGIVFAALLSLFYATAGHLLIHLMTDIDSVTDHARQYLLWAAIAPIVSVASFMLDGIFIGVTHTRQMRNAMLISLAVFLLASSTLPGLFGNHGLWAAYIVLMISRALTLLLWYPGILRHFDTRPASLAL